MLAGVAAIGLGLDTGVLAQVSTASTGGLEQSLVNQLTAPKTADIKPATADDTLPIEGELPSLAGAVQWLNSPPLSAEALRGKVVLIDFWTYSCINCLRTVPYVTAWAEKYKDQGLVVIGVHAPEFAFERDANNVKNAVKKLGVTYPVALDNDFKIWRAFDNQYWPAHYFVDANGHIRYHHFGEGAYAESEQVIQQLLREAGRSGVGSELTHVKTQGAQQGSDRANVQSPETYLGYERGEHFASTPQAVADADTTYRLPAAADLNQWGLGGQWKIGSQQASLTGATGSISYRFHARDLHLVMGPASDGKPVRFRVTIDGKTPNGAHGSDTAADGTDTVTEQRLYQLLRQPGDIENHTFSIEFLDPGVNAYAFTFG